MIAECLKTYSIPVRDDGSLVNASDHPNHRDHATGNPVAAEEILDRKIRQLMAEEGVGYDVAAKRVLAAPSHANLVADCDETRRPVIPTKPQRTDASQELDKAARKLMADGVCATYNEAAAQAVRRNPRLADAWNAGV